MVGGLRGRLHSMRNHMHGVCSGKKAFWWKTQFRGIIGWHAAFIGCSKAIFQELDSVSNAGIRLVMNLPRNYNHGLHSLKQRFHCCLHDFYAGSVVRYVGHCFRHSTHPISILLSLPLQGRLASLRLQGRRGAVSETAQATFEFLSNLGLSLDPLVGGFPQVRGHTGHVFRWGDKWLFEIRDGGDGWVFDRCDKQAVAARVELILDIFRENRRALAVMDSQLAIEG